MAKFWKTEHKHGFSWTDVATTYWQRYPNPNSGHVFSEDFIECDLKSQGTRLHTKRIITKTNKLPSWGQHFFSTRHVPMIEEAIVDLTDKTLTTYTRNINLRYFMGVTERVVFKPDPDNPDRSTLVEKEVWIESDVFGFQSAIKKFGVDRFKKNCIKATEGFEYKLNQIFKSNQSEVIKGAHMKPVYASSACSNTNPPSHSENVRLKLVP